MKYVDLTIQSISAGLLIGLLIALNYHGEFALVALLQFFVGAWQMLISLFSVLRNGSESVRRKHLDYSIIYIGIFIVGAILISFGLHVFPVHKIAQNVLEWIVGIYVFGLPWILAVYHYTISWKLVFNKHKKSSSFLPHINF